MKSTKEPLAGLRHGKLTQAHKRVGSGLTPRFLSQRVRRVGTGAGGGRRQSTPSETALRVLLGLALAGVLTFATTGRLPWHTLTIEEGDIANIDVRAPRSARLVNDDATEKLRQEAAAGVPKVYQVDTEARFDTLATADSTFAALRAARLDETGTLDERLHRLEQDLSIRLSRDALITGLTLRDPAVLDDLSGKAHHWLEDAFAKFPLHNDTDDLATQRQRLSLECEKLSLRNRYKDLLREVLEASLTRPNLVYDHEGTEKARAQTMLAVPEVYQKIEEGELLIREGSRVTGAELRRLEAVGLYTRRSSLREVSSGFVLSVCFLLLLGTFIRRYVPEIWNHPRLWGLVGILLAVGALTHKAGILLGWPPWVPVPIVSTVGMLVAVLLDVHLAVVVSAILSLLLGIMSGGEVWVPTAAWVSALIGVFGVGELQSRSQLARTGLLLSAVNTVVAVAVGTLAQLPAHQVLYQAGFGAVSGIAAAILTLGGAMFLERPFHLTTDLRLLELSNPNEPLLRRLLVEAPGTYHASIIIANLAETAADAIGADSLLVRVGCYYHDIGKIRRPYLFVENQFGAENPHDKMSPNLSVLAIQAHVKDGLELGRELRLPVPVLDIIAQHHGTTLVSFFYRQALLNQGDTAPEEASFRYPGPKPQTREAAVVMLADGVEAAVRALPNPTPNAVEERVRKIIRARLEDGQLNACNLTLRDLEVIEKSFARIMAGILHKRIEYPPIQLKALPGRTRKSANGSKGIPHQPNAAVR
ncbi:MAG: phosphohydrolase [Armatimonadetes bacterium CG_4_10_14_3_um_filter_66_18]|nr:HDIG domain-containing protein [Armatimonadota bacterium]PIU93854.1 MAG: phosphohydrolase [Armatimonadetes bacterium CG06_land_8_20_14_3_00_66_21]PIW15828.1 MAG: phosphohydrolase [Armatimonadetes bacterium CG17_big_fil_post_rev_8_21_14_2_50_66_6]PIX36954.1 MAG: phosphohydrolase [Armatimonadetes bacterium CG_4_8_14_3_um_filter_66_20]PIY49619.1 MAG: phosphohydrolase [Armatimonadetes bacterium CG_4_10_14_3_um_filter_66_18]PIZ34144.1 MAG: phosphohydrolase [Armatimonadetes bacterium CG_4_10_14_0